MGRLGPTSALARRGLPVHRLTRATCAPIRTKVDMADTAAWLAVWGDWCCGWGRPAHHDPRVTVDQQGRALCPDCRRRADG